MHSSHIQNNESLTAIHTERENLKKKNNISVVFIHLTSCNFQAVNDQLGMSPYSLLSNHLLLTLFAHKLNILKQKRQIQ